MRNMAFRLCTFVLLVCAVTVLLWLIDKNTSGPHDRKALVELCGIAAVLVGLPLAAYSFQAAEKANQMSSAAASVRKATKVNGATPYR